MAWGVSAWTGHQISGKQENAAFFCGWRCGAGAISSGQADGTVASIASATVSDAGRPAGRNSTETMTCPDWVVSEARSLKRTESSMWRERHVQATSSGLLSQGFENEPLLPENGDARD